MSDEDAPKTEEKDHESTENAEQEKQESPHQAEGNELPEGDIEQQQQDEENVVQDSTDEHKEHEDASDVNRKETIDTSATEIDIKDESTEPHEETEQEKEQLEVEQEAGEEVFLSDDKKNADEFLVTYDEEETEPSSLFLEQEEEKEEPESHPLDEYTDQQVIDLVQELETENRHLYLENQLFESFLRENDPSLLEGLEEIVNYCTSVTIEKEQVDRRRSSVFRHKYKLDSYMSLNTIAEGKGPKINISQKTDMIMRAMEDSQTKLEAFLKRCNIIKRNLKAELEEFSIRETEFKEATEIFEYNVVVQGVDKLTQRIPAEKFIRYMEEWLKSAQLQIEKLRLRIATLKIQYKKVSQQLIQRQELGENVHAVDFDQLEIENKHFISKIEQKCTHLTELKKMNGGANLVLSNHKKILQKQQEDYNKLLKKIEDKNKEIRATEIECEKADEELNEVIEKYENCKKMKSQYTVPEVMEYVRLKDKLHELRKNIKIWIRRKKIQDIALNTCVREMKNLTGRVDIDPNWFEIISVSSDDSGSHP